VVGKVARLCQLVSLRYRFGPASTLAKSAMEHAKDATRLALAIRDKALAVCANREKGDANAWFAVYLRSVMLLPRLAIRNHRSHQQAMVRYMPVVVVVFVMACSGGHIEIVSESDDSTAIARKSYDTALRGYADSRDPVDAYRAFSATVQELSPRLHPDDRAEAELRLRLLALKPLESVRPLPFAQQVEILATSVWPVVLGIALQPGESSSDYMARVCEERPIIPCDDEAIVPTPGSSSEAISVFVLEKLKRETDAGVAECEGCQLDPSYRDVQARITVLVLAARSGQFQSADKRRTAKRGVSRL